MSYVLLYELPVFVLMLESVSKCRNVFMTYVLFEHCFTFELFSLMTSKLRGLEFCHWVLWWSCVVIHVPAVERSCGGRV